MPVFDPYDLSTREREAYRRVDVPSPFDTAIAVVNPDGTTISSGGGGGTVTANQGTANTDANAWPVRITDGTHDALVTAAGALKVDGSAVTQPVSAASLPLPTGASTSALQTSGNSSLTSILANQTNGTQVVSVNNFPATQPVSGTVTVVQPTGTNLHAVIDSSALPTGAATAANQNTSNTSLSSILANQTNGTQVTTGSGNFTVVQTTGTNLHAVIDSGSVSVSNFPATQPVSGTVSVSNFPVTQPVSGTVTANQGTANSIGNSWPVEMTDGTNVLGTSAHPVRVDPTGTTTQPVSGTVTANAGTGTFAISAASLPLPSNAAQETGGNLATIVSNTNVPTSVTSFQSSVTTSEAALATNTSKSIALKSPSTNTDNIFLGTTGVTSSTGYMLAPGDAVSMNVTNSNLVHAISGSGTQTLTVLVNN